MSTWTDWRIETLQRLWTEMGQTASEIAEQIGMSRDAVLGKVRRLGLLKEGTSNAALFERAVEIMDESEGSTDIGEAFRIVGLPHEVGERMWTRLCRRLGESAEA